MPEAGSQAVAEGLGKHSSLAVDDSESSFVAGGDALPAAVTKLLVDLNQNPGLLQLRLLYRNSRIRRNS
jgi:hypothetical protein